MCKYELLVYKKKFKKKIIVASLAELYFNDFGLFFKFSQVSGER